MNELEKNKYWIWFSLIEGLRNKTKKELLKKYKTPEKIFNLKQKDLEKVLNIKEKEIEKIMNKNYKEIINKHLEYMNKHNIKIITIEDNEYPKNLKEIYDYPISLYIKGNKNILNQEKNIAIIGCREYSQYGKNRALYFSYNLAKENVIITSGLAKGIDSFSHIGTIQAKGKTIAVLGNGLDTIYPKENAKLADKIIQNNGAIISEYPLGTKPEKMNFPERNRIISGISKGIIVIEAKKKSGTMLTVDFALEQGKDIYAVPGNINSINSTGTNDLIKQGAKLVTHFTEIEV